MGAAPRRGARCALEAGALPGLLPGGRLVADDAARAQVAAAWNVDELPTTPGRDVDGILAAATDGTLGALLVGGIEPADFPDPDAVLAALDAANFVISLELRHSEVTERADVVFPVAPTTQKAGAFINWEGRFRPFQAALHGTTQQTRPVRSPGARRAGRRNGCLSGDGQRPTGRARKCPALGIWDGEYAPAPTVAAGEPAQPGAGEAVLAGWRMLLDNGRLQDGEPHLAGTAHPIVVRLSADRRPRSAPPTATQSPSAARKAQSPCR